MDNILTYIKWRKDVPMETVEFNAVDSLVLSQLAYALWEDSVSSEFKETVSLEQAIDSFFEKGYDKNQLDHGYFCSDNLVKMLKEMKNGERYKNLQLSGLRLIHDLDKQEQFGALTILLNKDTMLVAFCGTDSTVVGWKEDFNMCYMGVVPSQESAKNYLHDAYIAFEGRKIIITGHSKGGNLAVYAGAFFPEILQDQILAIYNNDGPGFSEIIASSENYKRISSLLHTYVPQSSIIGMIMEHEEDYTVVKSSQVSILQHDPFTWQCESRDFVHLKEVNKSSKIFDGALKEWIENMSYDEKEKFFDTIYHVLTESGISSSRFRDLNFRQIMAVIQNYSGVDNDSKKVLTEGIVLLLKAIYNTTVELNKDSEGNFRLF